MGQVSTYFFDDTDTERQTLCRRISPSRAQVEEQQERWRAVAEYLVTDLQAKCGYPIRTWLQGSYKFGTQVRPPRKGDEFDIDLGIYFCWSGGSENGLVPSELRRQVQASLLSFARTSEDVIEVISPPKLKCCRIRFKGDFHIDIPCYYFDEDTGARVLAVEGNTWEDSDPKAIYLWFKGLFDETKRCRVRRLVKYLKGWAGLKFSDDNGKPSSLLLTVLVAEAVYELDQRLPAADDEAFAAVLKTISDRLIQGGVVRNPIDQAEDLATKFSPDAWHIFVQKISIFSDAAGEIIQCDNTGEACFRWSLEFEHLFPLPNLDALNKSANNLPANVMIPEVRVNAVSRDNSNVDITAMNAIGPIPKNCDITFTIINSSSFPLGTEFSWTVRNEGEEAEELNDLGHKKDCGLQAEERSAYRGTHYMDCTALHMNRIVGLRRIPVRISGMLAVKRNPSPKPYPTRLQGHR